MIDRLQLDTSAESLAAKINASVVPDTVVLKITVTDASPIQAQRINDGVVKELKDFVAELETPPGSQNSAAQGPLWSTRRDCPTPRSPPTRCATSVSRWSSVCCSGSDWPCCARSWTPP